MVEENSNKTFWIIATVATILIVAACIITPMILKVQSVKTQIETIDYSAPAAN